MARLSHLAEPVLKGESDANPPLVIKRSQAQRRLKPDEVDELVTKYESGMSVKQLAEEFKINRGTVMDHLRRRGVETRRNVRKMDEEQVARLIQLYQSGLSLVDLGSSFEVNAETVRRELIRAGVSRRRSGKRSLATDDSESS
ncbi:MAG: helix-turn-helix domain-containing protein [bacterium]|nr:helix-turn-helix domain-containing protein [bacterium]